MRHLTRHVLVAAVGLTMGVGALAGPAQAGSTPQGFFDGAANHSLRGPNTDQNFYFVMADRFANADPANDTGGLGDDAQKSGFDPKQKGFYHGGDLAGLTSKLDYIKGLGTTSIWLTPIFKNKAVQLEDGPSAGYHGYWITDFTQVDPHLGSNADLTALVGAAHAKGMKVYFDIITNHTADVIGYQQGARTAYVPKDVKPYLTASGKPFDDRDYAGTQSFPPLDPAVSFPYTPVLDDAEKTVKVPGWLNDTTLYHNRGNTTFTGEDSQYGDFFGLDDLFTENPKVVNGMIDIYRTWIKDFGIDGYRIDTMKHVNDEFWKAFSPGIRSYATANGKPDFFMFGEVALDGSGPAQKAFTSHYTTEDEVQAILDFPFQDAARSFASKSQSAQSLQSFFANDDWYTDADSNAYSLPTFLGNHDMGRIGHFVQVDNPGAAEQVLLERDRLAHELMFFSRGNPVVYYGDEQGFTGDGGDQDARQDMFASQIASYNDDNLLGNDATTASANFDTNTALYQDIAALTALTKAHPALRNGAHQNRYANDGPGIYAFSRIDRASQREYVVALNNSDASASAPVPTYLATTGFSRLYGQADDALRTSAGRVLSVTVPPRGAVVYESDTRIPASTSAPRITLERPEVSSLARSRTEVGATVSGDSFAEVTFEAKVGTGPWQSIGTDDNAPYRVFHDTSGYRTGTPILYRATVLDNAGHSRTTWPRLAFVPAPTITITTPTAGGTVTSIDPVLVTATVDPERATQTVLIQRSVADGRWTTISTDSSSPVYTARDDVSALPIGARVRYRAILTERGRLPVISAVITVTTALPAPAREHVTLVGSLQSELGCPEDWNPACFVTDLSFDTSDGQWHRTGKLPEGSYDWKIAINGSWTENYGSGGASGGDNLKLAVPAGGATYRFSWNQVTHVPSVDPLT